MLLTLAIVLVVLWIIGVVLFKVTAAVIHIVLFLAVIAAIGYFVRRKAPRV